MIDSVIHHRDGTISYEWDNENPPTDWQKEAIREYGVTSKSEIEAAIAWRESIDEMDNEQAARVMRGKHPTDDSKEIGRPKNPGNRPDDAGQ